MDRPGEAQTETTRHVRETVRKEAAYRTARTWGLWLFLAAGCFCLLYWGLSVRREKSWTVQIRAALDRNDDALAAVLLHRCCAEAPAAASSPAMLALESELLNRQENRVRREKDFSAALETLRRMLADGTWRKRVMALEFAEAARLAPDEAALNRLRKLKLHYEALLQLQDSDAAAKAARQLGTLRKELPVLEALRRNGEEKRHAALLRRLRDALTGLRAPLEKFPEFLPVSRELETALQTEETAMREQALRARDRQTELQKLSGGTPPEELAERCRNFLALYPDSNEAPLVRRLEADLAWLALPWSDMVREKFAVMREKELQALTLCRTLLRRCAENPGLTGETRELARRLSAAAARLAPEELPDFLEHLEHAPEREADAAAQETLREKLDPVWSLLRSVWPEETPEKKVCAARFRLLREFQEECLNNLPVYAGVWCGRSDAAGKEFSPAEALREHGEAWVPGRGRQLEFLGEVHKMQLFPRSQPPRGFRLVLAPSGALRTAAERTKWKLRAAELGLPELPWPDFWPEKRR